MRGFMYKVTVKIDGMACGMCEAHICDTIRRAMPDAKKVKASAKRGEAVFASEEKPDAEALAKAISDTGYTYVSSSCETYEKRGLFG